MFGGEGQSPAALLARAEAEARALGHDYIGTEHLLTALSRASHTLAGQVLRTFKLDPVILRGAAIAAVSDTSRRRPGRRIPPTPRVREALKRARRELGSADSVLQLSEHVLIELSQMTECVAAQILEAAGVTTERLRDALGRAAFMRVMDEEAPCTIDWALSGGWWTGAQPLDDAIESADRLEVPLGELARRVMRCASWLAAGMGRRRPEVSHVALALATVEGGLAYDVLRTMGAAPGDEAFREASGVGAGYGHRRRDRVMDRVLRDSARLAREFHAPRISTGHLLLALLAEPSGEFADIMRRAGLDPDEVRRRTVDGLDGLVEGRAGPCDDESDFESDVPAVLVRLRAIAGASSGSHAEARPCPPGAVRCRVCGSFDPPAAQYCRLCGAAMGMRIRGGRECLDRFLRHLAAGVACRADRHGRRASLRHLAIAKRLIPGDVRPALEMARTYAAFGARRRALRWFRRVLRRRPDSVAALIEGAECFSRYAFLRRAAWLRAAVALRPHDAELRERFERNYGRLRWWERRLVGRPPAVSEAKA